MFDVNRDVNQTAGLVYHAKSTGHTSSVFILGGGSPKNFMLQTEPQIQEVMGIQEKGHDYFLQVTDARPDTGGLSGATPAEAVSWGKVDPDKLQEVSQVPISLIPSSHLWENLSAAWARADLGPKLLNSFIVAVGVTVGKIVLASLSAFAIVFSSIR